MYACQTRVWVCSFFLRVGVFLAATVVGSGGLTSKYPGFFTNRNPPLKTSWVGPGRKVFEFSRSGGVGSGGVQT